MSSIESVADFHELLRAELLSIPLAQWGFFFPVHVAAWRFLETLNPKLVGELDAGYDDEPFFKGRGADWFVTNITNSSQYLDLAEDIMYSVTSALPRASFDRGFVHDSELPTIDHATVNQLRDVILKTVESAT